jgi:hypothetical protein
MSRAAWIPALALLTAGCSGDADAPGATPAPTRAPGTPAARNEAPAALEEVAPVAMPTLEEARRGFVTRPVPRPRAGAPAEPPPGVFTLVRYDAPAGPLAAYLTPDPGDGHKHPAIIWITGGDSNTIDEVWEDAPRENDQTASAYRKAGIVMMFPSLRGGNDNPGQREGYLGEVDDVLAAAAYLARLDHVDPKRIYLGGHSTGGTLAMLVAECTDRFRAVFAFGPADEVRFYDPEYLPFDTSNPKELDLRSPGRWLHSVRCPLFVIEGDDPSSNIVSLRNMARGSINPLIHFVAVPGRDHFNVLAPVNEAIAGKILRDEGETTRIDFTDQDVRDLAGN